MLHEAPDGFFQMTSSRDLTKAKFCSSLTRSDAQHIVIELDLDPDTSISRQIIEYIEDVLALGIYHPGDILPSVAVLADKLDVSKRTVVQTYSQLAELGITESVSGKPNKIAATVDTRATFAERKFASIIRDLRRLPTPMSEEELRIASDTAVRKYFSKRKA
jgi:DNA-binding transcriptional regulator YhcF (GntR family)